MKTSSRISKRRQFHLKYKKEKDRKYQERTKQRREMIVSYSKMLYPNDFPKQFAFMRENLDYITGKINKIITT